MKSSKKLTVAARTTGNALNQAFMVERLNKLLHRNWLILSQQQGGKGRRWLSHDMVVLLTSGRFEERIYAFKHRKVPKENLLPFSITRPKE